MDGFSLADACRPEMMAVAVATLLAGALSGMTGFGGGLLLPPVLAPIIGVKAVVPVMSVAMLMANGHRLWLYRDQLDRVTAFLKDDKMGIDIHEVIRAAADLDYAGPNPLGRQLRRGRSGIVGVVVGDALGRSFRDPMVVQVLDGLVGTIGRLGLGVLLIVHDLALAAAVADRIVVMSDGRTIATGAPLEVLTSQLISDVWGVEAELVRHQGRSGLHVEWLEGDPTGGS